MSTAVKLRCDCEHKYQDAKYGKKVRVMNKMDNAMGGNRYKCTVCGRIHVK